MGGVREGRVKRAALLGVGGSAGAILTAYVGAFLPGGPPAWAPWVMMVGSSTMLVSAMAMGAARKGRIGALALPLAFVLVLLVAAFGLALVLPPDDPAHPVLWLGLPPRAALVLYGVGILPFLVLPLAYARTFPLQVLPPGEVERVREEALRARAGAGLQGPGGRSLDPGVPPRGTPPPDAASSPGSTP